MNVAGGTAAASSAGLAGRIALVTGGAGAIGSAIASALRDAGAEVVTVDAAGKAPSAAIAPRGTLQAPVGLDVRDRAGWLGLLARIDEQLGGVEILVNAAGIVSFGDAETLAEEEWDRVIDINLKGSFLACQAVIPQMRRRGFGRIVNIGSVVGKNAGNARPWVDAAEQKRAGNVAYGVSKAGVHAMTGFLAKEVARFGITVNAIAPGPIATAMTTDFPAQLKALIPVGRMGTVGDVAHAALFLCSADSSFITGEILDLNGGMWCD